MTTSLAQPTEMSMDSTLPDQMLKDAGGGFTVDKENKGAQRAGEEARSCTDSVFLLGMQPLNQRSVADTHSLSGDTALAAAAAENMVR